MANNQEQFDDFYEETEQPIQKVGVNNDSNKVESDFDVLHYLMLGDGMQEINISDSYEYFDSNAYRPFKLRPNLHSKNEAKSGYVSDSNEDTKDDYVTDSQFENEDEPNTNLKNDKVSNSNESYEDDVMNRNKSNKKDVMNRNKLNKDDMIDRNNSDKNDVIDRNHSNRNKLNKDDVIDRNKSSRNDVIDRN